MSTSGSRSPVSGRSQMSPPTMLKQTLSVRAHVSQHIDVASGALQKDLFGAASIRGLSQQACGGFESAVEDTLTIGSPRGETRCPSGSSRASTSPARRRTTRYRRSLSIHGEQPCFRREKISLRRNCVKPLRTARIVRCDRPTMFANSSFREHPARKRGFPSPRNQTCDDSSDLPWPAREGREQRFIHDLHLSCCATSLG